MSVLTDAIPNRKSVRSFDGAPLRREDREKLERFTEELDNPFGVRVRCVLLDAERNGLTSPVLTGATLYAAGLAETKPNWEAAFGFSFEKLVLYARSLGVGTVWIAGTLNRKQFERAAGLTEGWRMPCVTPLGYAAAKRSVKEVLMRRGIGADSRLPAEKLFFDGRPDRPLSGDKLAALARPLELTRWAPSAVNKQPWRLILEDGQAHFYEKKDRGLTGEATGDLQRIDVGIALCHFLLGLEDMGLRPDVTVEDPGVEAPQGAEYVATVRF